MRYEVIESKCWRHASGRTASIYGAAPWGFGPNPGDWEVQIRGWTVRNPHTGEVGACRQPWATREAAQAWADTHKPSRIGYGD